MWLDDVTVLDLTRLLPGPYATQLLADAGADVIKIEEPTTGDYARIVAGDDEHDVFSAVNRGKRSVTLDLGTDVATDAFHRLAGNADVVVESFRPGVADRLGVGYGAVREHNPGVVYCSLSGFGATGPHSDRAGHDLNYVGMAGLLDLTRAEVDGRPAIPGVPVADLAGGLFAAFAIAAALLGRPGDGSGRHLDVALTDVAMALTGTANPGALVGAEPRGRETLLTGRHPCYDVYETADGEYVTLAALEPEFWRTFCEAVDREDLVGEQYADDPAVREALRAEVGDVFRGRTREEWAELGDVDAMVAPVRSASEALDSPQARERGLLDRTGSGPRVGFPATLSGGPNGLQEDGPSGPEGSDGRGRSNGPGGSNGLDESDEGDGSVPSLGEHTEAVLREHGFDEGAIERLREAGAI